MPDIHSTDARDREIQEHIDHAIGEVAQLTSGETFMVRDLFLGYCWNRLSNYKRAQIGYGFYHQYAKVEGISEVEILEKSIRNQQMYRKF